MITKWFNKSKNTSNNALNDDLLIEKCSVYYIPCDLIRPNAMRSRCDFNEDKLINLAYSIKRYGVIEPICVRKTDIDDSYAYELIVGERRLRASRLAGLSTIPCIILDAEQSLSAELSVIENIYSEPLNYFEEAVALQRISSFNENCESFEEIATRLSISHKELSKKLWLLELDYNERQILLNMNVSEENAVGIAQIKDKEQRHRLIESICGEGLSDKSISERIANIECEAWDSNSNYGVPRDISSVIKSIGGKIAFLNRSKSCAKMNVSKASGVIDISIQIKL